MVRPFVPFDWTKDRQAFFLYVLANEVNLHIARNASQNGELFWFATATLQQANSRVLTAGKPAASKVLVEWSRRFTKLLVDALALQAACEVISSQYFDRHDVLLGDTRSELDSQTDRLREIAAIQNSVAPSLGIEPVTPEELAPDYPEVAKKVAEFVDLAEAEVLCHEGDWDAAILQLCPDLRIWKSLPDDGQSGAHHRA